MGGLAFLVLEMRVMPNDIEPGGVGIFKYDVVAAVASTALLVGP